MSPKNTPARKALASTIWFQHKHPETAIGPIGRITTAKRFHQFKAYVKEMVQNENIRNIILSNRSEVDASKQIVQYLIQKTGNIKNALAELKKLRQNEVKDPFRSPKFALKRETIRHARKMKLQKREAKEYARETTHIISSSQQQINGILDLAEIQLEGISIK